MDDYLNSHNSVKVLLMVGASWCNPCNNMKPNFISMSKMEKFSHIKFLMLDMDEDEDKCDELNIKKLPTYIYFENNTEKHRNENIKTLIELNNYVCSM
jgi:thiol-disulfide isomerase/thioredoxin